MEWTRYSTPGTWLPERALEPAEPRFIRCRSCTKEIYEGEAIHYDIMGNEHCEDCRQEWGETPC